MSKPSHSPARSPFFSASLPSLRPCPSSGWFGLSVRASLFLRQSDTLPPFAPTYSTAGIALPYRVIVCAIASAGDPAGLGLRRWPSPLRSVVGGLPSPRVRRAAVWRGVAACVALRLVVGCPASLPVACAASLFVCSSLVVCLRAEIVRPVPRRSVGLSRALRD